MSIIGRRREGRPPVFSAGTYYDDQAGGYQIGADFKAKALGVDSDYKNAASKAGFVEQTLDQSYDIKDQASRLKNAPVVADQGKIDAYRTAQQQQARRNLANAAQDGLVASSFLDSERRRMLQKRALAEVGLSAAAQAQRAEDINKLSAMTTTVQKAREDVPKGVARDTSTAEDIWNAMSGGNAGSIPVYTQARSEIDDNLRHTRDTLGKIYAARPTEQQLMASWEREIAADYDQAGKAMADDMRRRGMSDAYIQGEMQRHQADRAAALEQMRSTAKALTGPDPAAAQAALAALYTPDVQPTPQANPGWGGMAGGLIGAVAGGWAGGPAGARAGWEMGQGIGTVATQDRRFG